MGSEVRRTWARRPGVWVSAAVLALVGLALVWLAWPDSPPPSHPKPAPHVAAPPSPSRPPGPCGANATAPFAPTNITIPGVVAAAPVEALPRDRNNVPSTVPLGAGGKTDFAWDQPPGVMPGASEGMALFNAHTWPWPAGGALGNLMLTGLHQGGIIIVSGAAETQCYRVTHVDELTPEDAAREYYAPSATPQIAIVVCSGERLGPENWTHRTIWFASPYSGPA